MINNYLKLALKTLLNQKLYSFINIFGLGLGLACFILIALYVQHEFSYESVFSDSDRIYRVSRDYYETAESGESRPMGISAPVAGLLKQDFSQIEDTARIFVSTAVLRTDAGDPILEDKYVQADNALFNIFDFQWISGDPDSALNEPYTLVLTRSAAERYFGDADPVGRTLFNVAGGDPQPLLVTGFIEDLSDNTHLDFDVMESMLSWTDCRCEFQEILLQNHNNWEIDYYATYIKLREGNEIGSIQAGSAAFFERYYQEGSSVFTGYSAIPITDIYLFSDRDSEAWSPTSAEKRGSFINLIIFASVAVLLIVLACINFVNLATARSSHRLKEIGVRQAVGACRRQLIEQFFLEACLMTVLSVIVAVCLVEIVLPFYSAFLAIDLEFNPLASLGTISTLVLLTIIVAIAAGGFPSLFLSRIRPEQALKDSVVASKGSPLFREILVFCQFSISIAVIIATAVVFLQMRFVNSFDLGFDRENVITANPNVMPPPIWQTLKDSLVSHPEIIQATSSTFIPFQNNNDSAQIRRADGSVSGVRMEFMRTDYDFFSLYNIEILAGREFLENSADGPVPENESRTRVSQAFVINESAARALGWSPQQAIGQSIELSDMEALFLLGALREASGPVVGVVRDVFFESVHNVVQPAVYFLPPFPQPWASIRLTGNNTESTLAFIQDTYEQMLPLLPVFFDFLEQDYSAVYQEEVKLSQTFMVFALLTVLIACLGLLGLSSYAAERRTKEIGIRKVMGSSIWQIVLLFTNDYSKLVLAANLIAWPVAYFAMNRWLENFAYRIDLTPLIFIGSGLIALCIAWVTVGGTAAKAASQKPVLALRYE